MDDSNTSIGKRYARNDELGTPFGVTLDFACEYGPDDESAKGANVTNLTHSGPEPDDDTTVSGIHFTGESACSSVSSKPRERDTTGQLIGGVDEVISVLIDLVNGTTDWTDACKLLPAYDGIQAID